MTLNLLDNLNSGQTETAGHFQQSSIILSIVSSCAEVNSVIYKNLRVTERHTMSMTRLSIVLVQKNKRNKTAYNTS